MGIDALLCVLGSIYRYIFKRKSEESRIFLQIRGAKPKQFCYNVLNPGSLLHPVKRKACPMNTGDMPFVARKIIILIKEHERNGQVCLPV